MLPFEHHLLQEPSSGTALLVDESLDALIHKQKKSGFKCFNSDWFEVIAGYSIHSKITTTLNV